MDKVKQAAEDFAESYGAKGSEKYNDAYQKFILGANWQSSNQSGERLWDAFKSEGTQPGGEIFEYMEKDDFLKAVTPSQSGEGVGRLQWVSGYKRMPVDIKKVKVRTRPNEDDPNGTIINPAHILEVDEKGIKVDIPVKEGTMVHIGFYGFEWLDESATPTPSANQEEHEAPLKFFATPKKTI